MVHRALATIWSQLLEQAPAIALLGAGSIVTLFLANPKPRWLLPLAFGLTAIGVALWVAAATKSRRENPGGLTTAEVVRQTGDHVVGRLSEIIVKQGSQPPRRAGSTLNFQSAGTLSTAIGAAAAVRIIPPPAGLLNLPLPAGTTVEVEEPR